MDKSPYAENGKIVVPAEEVNATVHALKGAGKGVLITNQVLMPGYDVEMYYFTVPPQTVKTRWHRFWNGVGMRLGRAWARHVNRDRYDD